MKLRRAGRGWVEVICGPMFSGKTEELIRRLRRAELARQRVQAFKPAIDDRYDGTRLASHSSMLHAAEAVGTVADLARRVREDTEVVGIDEAQFFSPELVELVQTLANGGKRVLIAGLDQDYLGRPFEPVPHLMAIAEEVTKCAAVCACCGEPASRSQRLVPEDGAVVRVGAADAYEARCRACIEPTPSHRWLAAGNE